VSDSKRVPVARSATNGRSLPAPWRPSCGPATRRRSMAHWSSEPAWPEEGAIQDGADQFSVNPVPRIQVRGEDLRPDHIDGSFPHRPGPHRGARRHHRGPMKVPVVPFTAADVWADTTPRPAPTRPARTSAPMAPKVHVMRISGMVRPNAPGARMIVDSILIRGPAALTPISSCHAPRAAVVRAPHAVAVHQQRSAGFHKGPAPASRIRSKAFRCSRQQGERIRVPYRR